jgi:hypothetical protein
LGPLERAVIGTQQTTGLENWEFGRELFKN